MNQTESLTHEALQLLFDFDEPPTLAKIGGGSSEPSSSGESCHLSPLKSLSQPQKRVVAETAIKPTDIFCGRDRLSHNHPGNRRFRHLINMYRDSYQTATQRDTKTLLTAEIVAAVQCYGGRFLKRQAGEWIEVDATYAHEKVSHALRSAKDPNRPKIKRKRRVLIKPPSDEEERVFQSLAAEQKEIFLQLMKRRPGDQHTLQEGIFAF
jgi:hypothetical protein